MGVVLKVLILLLFFSNAQANWQWFDELRGKVNETWYNTIIGKCEPTKQESPKVGKFLNERGYCQKDPGLKNIKTLEELTPELQEKLFFDSVLVEQSKDNQCLFDYWSAMSIMNPVKAEKFSKANKDLLKEHSFLNGKLDLSESKTVQPDKAYQAQKSIVSTMIAKAIKIAEREKQIQQLSIKTGNSEEIQKLTDEVLIELNSLPLSEDSDARDFYENVIYATVRADTFSGKPLDTEKILSTALAGKDSFQRLVVDEKMNKITSTQNDLAKINGDYKNQHSYKVSTFASGSAHKLLLQTGTPVSQELFCSLESRYGIGSEVSTLSSTLAATAATGIVGGWLFTATRLAQSGLITARAANMAQALGGTARGAIFGAEFVPLVLQTCFDSNTGQMRFSDCQIVERVKTEGIDVVVNKDQEISECVRSVAMGLAAGGGAALLSARAIRSAPQVVNTKLCHDCPTLSINRTGEHHSGVHFSPNNHTGLSKIAEGKLMAEKEKKDLVKKISYFSREKSSTSLFPAGTDIKEIEKALASGKGWSEVTSHTPGYRVFDGDIVAGKPAQNLKIRVVFCQDITCVGDTGQTIVKGDIVSIIPICGPGVILVPKTSLLQEYLDGKKSWSKLRFRQVLCH